MKSNPKIKLPQILNKFGKIPPLLSVSKVSCAATSPLEIRSETTPFRPPWWPATWP